MGIIDRGFARLSALAASSGAALIGKAGGGTVQDLANKATWGAGTPEGAVAASVGTLYLRTDGGAGTTLYVKESGTGNTGWVAK